MRVVLLGAPGSGKGTQAKLLMEKHRVPQISTGDLLREAIRDKTLLGMKAREAIEAGQPVPNGVVLGMISNRLADDNTANGFILDGFPRNIEQARALDAMLQELGKPLQLAIILEVDADILLQRLTGRRTCIGCGAVYNVYTSPPKMDDRCDDCGDVLKHRPDDSEATIEQRLRIFQTQIRPLIAYYRDQYKLRTIQAIGDVNDIFAGIDKIVSQIDQMPVVEQEPLTPVDEIVNAPSLVVTEPLPPVVLPEVVKKQTKVNTRKTAANDDGSEMSEKASVKKKAAKKKIIKKMTKKAALKKKPAAKKAVAKKKVVKKRVAKKINPKKKSVAKKKVVKKKQTKKKTVKKHGVKKTAKRVVPKKKVVTRKVVKKKPSVKKAAVKKAAKKKAPTVKKPTAKKRARRKSTIR